MTSPPAKPGSTTRRTRPVRSCTQCKQMKHGCDARNKHPRPCSRCTSKGLECVVDVQFRRTPTRERLNELNRELRSLRETLKESGSVNTQQSTSASSSTTQGIISAPHGSHSIAFCCTEEALLEIEDSQIGDCFLTRNELIPLFATFALLFYKHLPILDPSMTPRAMQTSTPFLFWTIITIVVQRSPEGWCRQKSAIIEAYEQLLSKAIFATPLTLPTIQGILYISTWPLAVKYQARDQSWNLIGMAVNAALYSGLHKSTHPHSLRSIGVFGDSPIRSTLWLGCFYTSTWISQSIGVPPTLRSPEDLATIARITSDQATPRHFAAMSEMQICTAKYTVLISECSEGHLATSLERAFKSELDLIKDRFTADWNVDIETIFLTAKLHLVATLVVTQNKQLGAAGEGSSDTTQGSTLRVNLSEGFSFAVRLIQLLCLRKEEAHESNTLHKHSLPISDLYMQGLPKLFFRALVFSAFYLQRYHTDGSFSSAADGKMARNHVDIVCDYLWKQSSNSSDEAGRAAAAIEALNRYSASKGMRTMRISDRMGASIFYDGLTMASELRTKPVRLMSDQDEPQQRLGGSKIPVTQSSVILNNALMVEAEFRANHGPDSLEGVPSEFVQDFDMEFGELSRDLFSKAALFS